MSLLQSSAMQQPAETQYPAEPLPLFRPEVLSKQERFFGEVLLIRPFSFGFLGWLVLGAAVLFAVLFFGTYTETAPVPGDLRRGQTLEGSRLASPGNQASVARQRRLIELFKPSSNREKPRP